MGLIRACARLAAAEYACTKLFGRLAAEAASTWAGAEAPIPKPGYNGQVIGAVAYGVEPDAACAIIAAICIAIAQ